MFNSQEAWDLAEALSHELKHPFKDRRGQWHYKEQSFVEQVIREYCYLHGLHLADD